MMPSPEHRLEHLVESAGAALATAWERDLELELVEQIASPNTLLRCSVQPSPTPRRDTTVIVKHVTSTAFTAADRGEPSPRLLNEWASLQFLARRGRFGPRVLAGLPQFALLVLEDLGKHPRVMDRLNGDSAERAGAAIVEVGRFLGRMQAATLGQEASFRPIQATLGTASPRSDSTYDLRQHEAALIASCAHFGLDPPGAFWVEVNEVERTIHSPGPFRAFLHADAGPQNFLWIDESVIALDYEFGTFGFGLLDLVSARLGFPHSLQASTVPAGVVEALELAYRSELASVVPEAHDDTAFVAAVTDACAHWALVRWAGLWRALFHETGGRRDASHDSDTVALSRSQAYTVYESFLDVAAATGRRPAIASVVDAYSAALRERFPELDRTGVYPAFAPDPPADDGEGG